MTDLVRLARWAGDDGYPFAEELALFEDEGRLLYQFDRGELEAAAPAEGGYRVKDSSEPLPCLLTHEQMARARAHLRMPPLEEEDDD